ncbi:MAG: PHP domain-containing protein [Ardenticatenaceae bacterium]|nr:PHP domain-containing protein [Ardenticatenaceae bacterium]
MIIDLHVHSTASDGTLSPGEVVNQAANASVQIVALTDHDTLDGATEAAPAAAAVGITLLRAVELNTDASGAEVDILGYFWEEPPDWFQAFLIGRQNDRIRRAKAIVARLTELGLPISYARVRELAHGIVARPHIAQAMIERGYVASQREAYERYIGFGAPAYAERDELDPQTAIAYVQAAGGLAVLGHPGLIGNDDIVEIVIGAGIDGLEAYYAFHSPEETARYLAVAQRYDLAVTAGSDAHGPGRKKSRPIGVPVPDDLWPAFERRLRAAVERQRPRLPRGPRSTG